MTPVAFLNFCTNAFTVSAVGRPYMSTFIGLD